MMKRLLMSVMAAILLFVCGARGAETRPNIVFILIDDLGYGDLGCTGDPQRVTPNIDRLASEGVRLTQFDVSSPVCSPSRCGLLTGQYPTRWGILSYISDRQSNGDRNMRSWLDLSAPCLARQLKAAGYATAHIGKWHLGGGRDVGDCPLITEYGFDVSFTQFEGLGDRALINGQGLSEQSAKLGRGKIEWHDKHELSGVYVDRVLKFMREHKDQLMYVNLWPDDVHDPHQPVTGEVEKYRKQGIAQPQAKLYAVLENLDRQVGRLVDEVEKMGLREKTMFILTGDNGPTCAPDYYKDGGQPPGSTSGLRGRKLSLFEGGTREPFIVNWKGHTTAGKVNETTVMTGVDFFPSVCALSGAKLPEGAMMDGEDLSAAMLGSAEPMRKGPIFWHYIRRPAPAKEREQSPRLAMRQGQWKLVVEPDGSRIELYDLAADRAEERNVAEQNLEVVERMKGKVMAWFDEVRKSRKELEKRLGS
ncbi:MAG TPA: sulfatase-like hydrolase/transferase [Tepidisphaeraceae bacterium]